MRNYFKYILLVCLTIFLVFSLISLSRIVDTNDKEDYKPRKNQRQINVPFNWNNIRPISSPSSSSSSTPIPTPSVVSLSNKTTKILSTNTPSPTPTVVPTTNFPTPTPTIRPTVPVATRPAVVPTPTPTPTPSPNTRRVVVPTSSQTTVAPTTIIHTPTNFSYDNTKKVYAANKSKNMKRAEEIKGAMKYAWDKYVEYSWGKDELLPLTQSGKNWFHMGLTIIDSIDTLYLMGLQEEYTKARNYIEHDLDHFIDSNDSISVFEANIRFLGAYLSMYHFTSDILYLDKALEMGQILLNAFQNNDPFPQSQIYVAKNYSTIFGWTGGCLILADVGTLFLEFTELSRASSDPRWKEKSDKMLEQFEKLKLKTNGHLIPQFLSPNGESFCGNTVSMGGLSDSFYEYTLKMALYHDKRDNTHHRYKKMYNDFAEMIVKDLYKKTKTGISYLTILHGDIPSNTFEHLACMSGGMLALGAVSNISGNKTLNDQYFKIAEELTQTCAELYFNSTTGLGPEVAYFNPDIDQASDHILYHNYFSSPAYFLRPETIESLFYMYRFTGDTKYQEWGWRMFEAIEKYCKTENGYVGFLNVNMGAGDNPTYENLQQSFFMAETLKYLYLLFSDSSLIPLDKYVFNTEAHPFSIPNKK
ncbi:glycoside hydrolase family 47 protein [Cavenderia fasciculata]|uniref:alpha-1,2-Mannosidase n=1 Tax=Cavenderia fasciculata TaxID=261658 RepID=F4Q470_CACFS|nr:glycoside hydrolase family 47 protein [Cavenderia fasciculata]EGG17772.1 glycoside hydrolase family 47 protein [Cavenderia fasciculata]|eukprot:XP_004356256.1 glycoside hydrolase family 47 protein [Cavenderia fasciculata]